MSTWTEPGILELIYVGGSLVILCFAPSNKLAVVQIVKVFYCAFCWKASKTDWIYLQDEDPETSWILLLEDDLIALLSQFPFHELFQHFLGFKSAGKTAVFLMVIVLMTTKALWESLIWSYNEHMQELPD